MSLKISKLAVNHGAFQLNIEDLSFSNGLHIIIGANGSGKSTFLHALIGYDAKSRDVSFNNRALNLKRDVSFIPQRMNLPQMTVKDFVELTSEKDSTTLLKSYHLQDKKSQSTESLSGGEFKRASFLQALLEDKEIMIFDELEQGLDIEYKKQIFTELKRLSKDKIIILNVHDLSLALNYASYIYGIKNGEVVISTPPEMITEQNLNALFNTEVSLINYEGKRAVIL